ncbi:MAG: MFS transporter [Actinomycetota bacterium]
MSAPRLREQVRRIPRAAWILFGAAFVNRAGTFVFPFLTLYLTDRGEPPTAAGVAVALYAVGAVPARLAGGLIADRIGRRNAIASSMIGAAGLTLLLWRSSSLAAIYACVVALGLVADIAQPAAKALIADLLVPELRVTGFTLWRIATNAGWAAGLAIGGLLVDRSFDLLFLGDAATSFAFGAIALAFLPHGVRTARHEERGLPSARREILADRGFLAFLASTFLGGLVYSQNIAALPLHIRDLGYPASTYGLLQSLNGVLVVTVEVVVISVTRRFPRPAVFAVGQGLVGVAFLSLVGARSIPALVAMVAVWTLGEMTIRPVASATVADRAPRHARGRYQAAENTALGLSLLLGPVAGTALYGWRPDVLWIACGVVGACSALAALGLGRSPAPHARPASSEAPDPFDGPGASE